MAGINVSIDDQKFTAAKFAKEIKLNDVLKNIKNIDKCIVEEMFNSVAGEDGILQGTELEAFLKKVKDASGDDKKLTPSESENFAASRASGFLGPFAARLRNSLFREFIKQLFVTNEQKLKQEEAAKQNEPKPVKPEDKFYENGKLVKKIIYKEDGTTVEQQFKNGRLTREITKTPDGKMKDKTIDKDGNRTFHRPVKGGGETFVIYDKNNKKIGEGTVDKNGNKETNYLEGGNVVKTVEENKELKFNKTIVFNKDKTPKEEYYTDTQNGYKSHTQYFYSDGKKTKEVTKEKSGRNTTTTFKDGKEYQPARKVEVDEKGNKFVTDYTYANESAVEASKEVLKDGNGKVLSTLTRKFDKEGKVLEETCKDASGKKDYVTTYRNGNRVKQAYFYGDGTTKTITYGKNTDTEEVRDNDGNLKSTRIITKNAQGDTTKEVEKDGNGKVVKTTTYTANGYIEQDGNGKVLSTSEKTKTSKGTLWTHKDGSGKVKNTDLHTKTGFIYTHYRDGKPLCSEEYNRNTDETIFRNDEGKEIDRTSYNDLRKQAKTSGTER